MLGANSFFTLDGLNKTSTSFAASNGAIMKDAQQVDATASKMLIQENETLSACLINDGQAAWQFSIAADQGIIYDEQLLDIGGKQTLVAITFDGNLTIDGEVVESHGGRDILFVLLDQEGNLVGSKHYGSVHDEDVKQVVYKNGFVHFGGNYSGPTPMRQIGSLNFLQGPDWRLESFPIATYNRPYLSYISLESFETKKESQNDLERISNLQGQQPYDLTVEVIPNPTTGLLWLKIDADMQISSDLQILDATGKEVYRQQLSIAAQATETLQLDLSAQPNGLYFYRILGENTIYSSGKIVLQKTN